MMITPMTSPFLSGLASLILSINPNLSAAEVRNLIYIIAYDVPTGGGNTASGCSTTSGIDDCTGHGLIDLEATLINTPATGGNAGGGSGGGGCTAAFISFWPGIYHQFGFLGIFLMIAMFRSYSSTKRKQK